MTLRRRTLTRVSLAALPLAWLGACATPRVPLQVNVAGVQCVEGEPMELRLVARLRVQNANDAPMGFDGAGVELQLRGRTIGTGVTEQAGAVPGFGEFFVDVPITVHGLAEVRQATGLYGAPNRKLDVVLKGRLSSTGFEPPGFEWRGELALPLPAGS